MPEYVLQFPAMKFQAHDHDHAVDQYLDALGFYLIDYKSNFAIYHADPTSMDITEKTKFDIWLESYIDSNADELYEKFEWDKDNGLL